MEWRGLGWPPPKQTLLRMRIGFKPAVRRVLPGLMCAWGLLYLTLRSVVDFLTVQGLGCGVFECDSGVVVELRFGVS